MASAAFVAINKAVAKAMAEAIFEAKRQVIDEMIAFLGEKIEIDEDMQGYFDEFKAKLALEKIQTPKAPKGANGEAKKKREPSAYNLWIKNKMAEIKRNDPEVKGKAIMALAISEWKKLDVKPTKEEMLNMSTEEDTQETKPKGRKAKATDEEPKPKATKGRKPAKATEEETEEEPKPKATKGRKPAKATEEDTEKDTEEEPKPAKVTETVEAENSDSDSDSDSDEETSDSDSDEEENESSDSDSDSDSDSE